jgi:hypothetical protein
MHAILQGCTERRKSMNAAIVEERKTPSQQPSAKTEPLEPQGALSADEPEALHAADRQAAAMVAGLLMGLMATGLTGYLLIALWVATHGS